MYVGMCIGMDVRDGLEGENQGLSGLSLGTQ